MSDCEARAVGNEGQVAYVDLVTLRRKRLVVDFAFAANELPVANEQELAKAVAARAGTC